MRRAVSRRALSSGGVAGSAKPVRDRPRSRQHVEVPADRLRVVGERLASRDDGEHQDRNPDSHAKRPQARNRSTSSPTSPDTTSMLWPWRTSALAGHAVHGSLFDPNNAVVRSWQRTERASKPKGKGAGDHAQRCTATPARRTFLPQRAARAHHPSAELRAAESAAGEAAAHRRTQQHGGLGGDGVAVQHVEDENAAEAVADEAGLAREKRASASTLASCGARPW